MNTQVQNVLSIYCDSYLAIKKPLYWKASGLYIRLCALAYAFEGNRADPQALLEAIDYIKMNTKWFSYLRSAKVYSAAYLIAAKKNIESEFPRLVQCYDALKSAGFSSSTYLAIAAYALYETTPRGAEQSKALTARLIYEAMKKHHRFITSTDDFASAVVLASSDTSIDGLMLEIENTYQALKTAGLHSGNGLQLLSQTLSFDLASPDVKAQRCKNIADSLKDLKQRVSSMYYGTIGFIALTGDKWEEAIKDVVEALNCMKKAKCFSLGQREFNLMIAAALVCKSYIDENKSSQSTMLRVGIGATVEAIIAAQAATCAAVAASTAASSSS